MSKSNKAKIRKNAKYPALDKTYNLRIRKDLFDQDYIEKLNEKEKDFLNRFNAEWINSDLRHKGKKFHKTKKERSLIYGMNNARNRDSYALTNSVGLLKDASYMPEQTISNPEEIENAIIAIIDGDETGSQ